MAHCGLLRNYRFSDSSEAAEDIRGAKLYGVNDEKLGKIEDVIFDHSTGFIHYVVVDTGGWLSSKRFLVPADRLKASVEHEDNFEVGLTKEQIESFPPYNESDESEQGWSDYEKRYRSKWESGPVMHRMGTDRNITPTTKQMEDTAAGTTTGTATRGWAAGSESGDTKSSTMSTDRIVPAGTDTVEIS